MKSVFIKFLLLIIPFIIIGYIIFDYNDVVIGIILFFIYYIYNKLVNLLMNKDFYNKYFSVKKMLIYCTLLIIPLLTISYIFMKINNIYLGIALYLIFFLYEKILIQKFWYGKLFKNLKATDFI